MSSVAAAILRTPLGRRVKVGEKGTGTPVVLLHSGVGSAEEWKQVLPLWPLTGEALTTVPVPVHIVEGSRTSAVDRAICDVALRHVPRVEASIIHGAGHTMPLTHPAELIRILVAAVASASSAGALANDQSATIGATRTPARVARPGSTNAIWSHLNANARAARPIRRPAPKTQGETQ